MFLAGTKNHGQAWVPERPTFLEFLTRAPRDGWAGRLLDGSATRVVPDPSHVAATDWSYMGFARIRWKWRPQPPSIAEIVEAWDRGGIEDLMARSLRRWSSRTAAPRRSRRETNSSRWPWCPGCSANLDEAIAFSQSSPYSFWVRLLDESTRLPLSPSCSDAACRSLLKETIAIAQPRPRPPRRAHAGRVARAASAAYRGRSVSVGAASGRDTARRDRGVDPQRAHLDPNCRYLSRRTTQRHRGHREIRRD